MQCRGDGLDDLRDKRLLEAVRKLVRLPEDDWGLASDSYYTLSSTGLVVGLLYHVLKLSTFH